MNQTIRPMTDSKTTSEWRLWIDRCGGFGLLAGSRYTIGGARPERSADVRVRADWRRHEGSILRREGDYFWRADASTGNGQERFLSSGSVFPISGSATLRLTKPSPLSNSAVLSLDPPHRFEDHVDHMLLVDQTILIGPAEGNHIRCSALDRSAVLVFRDGGWKAKLKPGGEQPAADGPGELRFVDVRPGHRVSLGDIDMMLELA